MVSNDNEALQYHKKQIYEGQIHEEDKKAPFSQAIVQLKTEDQGEVNHKKY